MCIWHPIELCFCEMITGLPKLYFGKIHLTDYLKKSPEYNYFKDNEFFSIEVSNKNAGILIGKDGRNIRELRKKYQSKILISNENGKRYLYISQSPDKSTIIQQLMCKIWN